MTVQNKQKGFSIVEVLVAVVGVGVLAIGGWFVWHQSHQRTLDKSQTTGANTSTNQSPQSTQTSPTYDPSEGGKYLVIQEWGVRMPLSPDLQGDVIYGLRKVVDVSGGTDTAAIYGQTVYFASKKLAAIKASPNNCGLRAGAQDDRTGQSDPTSYEGPGPGLSRSLVRPHPYSKADFQIGDYWYTYFGEGSETCYGGSDGTQESQFNQSVLTALKSTMVVPAQ